MVYGADRPVPQEIANNMRYSQWSVLDGSGSNSGLSPRRPRRRGDLKSETMPTKRFGVGGDVDESDLETKIVTV